MTKDNVTEDSPVSSSRASERPAQPHVAIDTKKDLGQKIKESPAAQFEYGRASQHKTERYGRGSRRLEQGNPDVGDIDLGNIESAQPTQPDDNDHFD